MITEATRRPTSRSQPGPGLRVLTALLVVKIVQWLLLVVASMAGPWPGLPTAELVPLVLAGCWVISSAVWVWGRHWLGLVSACCYAGLSLVVSVTELADGTNTPWNVITALGSAAIVVLAVIAAVRGELAGSRW